MPPTSSPAPPDKVRRQGRLPYCIVRFTQDGHFFGSSRQREKDFPKLAFPLCNLPQRGRTKGKKPVLSQGAERLFISFFRNLLELSGDPYLSPSQRERPPVINAAVRAAPAVAVAGVAVPGVTVRSRGRCGFPANGLHGSSRSFRAAVAPPGN